MKRVALMIAVLVALTISTTAAFAEHCPYGSRSRSTYQSYSRYGSPYRGNNYGNSYRSNYGYRGNSPYGSYGTRYGSTYPRYSNYGPYGSYGRSGVSIHFGF